MSGHTKNGRTSRKGAFINSIWYCDCEPRMPADKFQTKNGGRNHGKWFYTCQKTQHKRCGFFLWTDDAKVREEAAVLNNSTSEPGQQAAPQTPRKDRDPVQPLTPFSRPKLAAAFVPKSAPLLLDASVDAESDERYDWSSGGDDDLAAAADVVVSQDFETPRKVARKTYASSPSKRPHSAILGTDNGTAATLAPEEDDVFTTPATSNRPGPLATPSSHQGLHGHNTTTKLSSGNLIPEVLEILKPANVSSVIEGKLVELLTKHELRTQGIVKGRDITRVAVQAKERKIAELQARIVALEAERESSRTVIAHLKQDIATSPKRPRRPQAPRLTH